MLRIMSICKKRIGRRKQYVQQPLSLVSTKQKTRTATASTIERLQTVKTHVAGTVTKIIKVYCCKILYSGISYTSLTDRFPRLLKLWNALSEKLALSPGNYESVKTKRQVHIDALTR